MTFFKKIKAILCLFAVISIAACTPPGTDPTPQNFTLTAQGDANGSVTCVPDLSEYPAGSTVTLTAVPNANYVLDYWEGDLTGNTNPVDIIMDTNKNVTAVFREITAATFTISTSVTGNGSITLSPTQANYPDGTTVTVTAAPAADNKFTGWGGDLSGSTNPQTFAISQDMTISAAFEPITWTVLIHFAVDNNIDYAMEESNGIISNYLAALETIEANDTNNNIDIVVLMDGHGPTANFTDGYYHLSGGAFAGDIVQSQIEINSGAVSTTTGFMDWAVANYPSDHYMYSVFNHGSGFDDQNTAGTYGIGFDDSSNDCLSHYELGLTTAHLKGLIGHDIELFYTYACLMGGVELAYEVRENADYLLFSEELFPAEFWSYEALSAITSNPDISGADLGTAFCDSAFNFFNGNREFTLSLIDLSTIDALCAAIETYATTAVTEITNQQEAEEYMTLAFGCLSMMRPMMPDYYYIDLGDYMTELNSASFTSPAVKAAAVNVNTAIGNSVVYMRQAGYPRATGISIFHNILNSFFMFDPAIPSYYNPVTYENILTFGADFSWDEYITALETAINVTTADHYEAGAGDDTSATPNNLSPMVDIEYHTIHDGSDSDWFRYERSTVDQTILGFTCENNSITATAWFGDAAGPVSLAGVLNLQTPVLLGTAASSGSYLWIQVTSNAGGTAMYRAGVVLYTQANLNSLQDFQIVNLGN